MSDFVRLMCAGLAFSLLVAGPGGAAEVQPAPAKDSEIRKSEPPAPLSEEVLRFLNGKITLRVTEMSPALALNWAFYKGKDIPLKPRQSKTIAARKMNFEFDEVTLATALRIIGTMCDCQYRIVKGEIRMATAEEWAQMDAGMTDFEKIAATDFDKIADTLKADRK